MIIGMLLLAAAAGFLGWRWHTARQALLRCEAENQDLQQEIAVKQNLQRMLTERNAEIRRLRAGLRQREADARALEEQASQLNLKLFDESGRRILAEKEEGARRMKLELLERQLDEAAARRREDREAAKKREGELLEIIERQQQRLDKLSDEKSRRARRARQDVMPDQVTISEILARAGVDEG